MSNHNNNTNPTPETKETTLSSVLDDLQKRKFITNNKINLTYCNITTIGIIPRCYWSINRLHLSHNKITNLDGIEQFTRLNYVSLGFNNLKNWKELLKIGCKNDIQEVIIAGNPLDMNPNYAYQIYDNFPNIYKIDDIIISPNDKKILNRYVYTSSLILPFFINLDHDQKIIQKYHDRIKLMKEIRNHRRLNVNDEETNSLRFQIEQVKNLVNEMKHELRVKLDHVDFGGIIKDYGFKSAKSLQSLKHVKKLITSIYTNFEDFMVCTREALYETYKFLFNEIMLRYFNAHDKTFDAYLTQEVIANEKHYDLERFSNDTLYAFDCILYEFYKLMPVQATLGDNLPVEFDAPSNMNKKGHRMESKPGAKMMKMRMITSVDIDFSNPINIKNLSLTHFPVFPLNPRYTNFLLEIITNRLEIFQTILEDFNIMIKSIIEPKKKPEILPLMHNHDNKSLIYNTLLKDYQRLMSNERKKVVKKRDSSVKKKDSSVKKKDSGVNTESTEPSLMHKTPTDPKLKTRVSEGQNTNSHLNKTLNIADKLRLPITIYTKLHYKIDILYHTAFDRIKEYAINHCEYIQSLNITTKLERLVNILDKHIRNKAYKLFICKLQHLYFMQMINNHYVYSMKNQYFKALLRYTTIRKLKIMDYYKQNVKSRVFYGLKKLKLTKRERLRGLIVELNKRLKNTVDFHFCKWKLVTVASRYVQSRKILPSRDDTLPSRSHNNVRYKAFYDNFDHSCSVDQQQAFSPYWDYSKNMLTSLPDAANDYYDLPHDHNRSHDPQDLGDEFRLRNKDLIKKSKSFKSGDIRVNSQHEQMKLMKYDIDTIRKSSKSKKDLINKYFEKYGSKQGLSQLDIRMMMKTTRRSPSPDSIFRKCNACNYYMK